MFEYYKGTFPREVLNYKYFDFQGQRPSQRSRRHGARVVGALTVGQTMGTSEREEIIKKGFENICREEGIDRGTSLEKRHQIWLAGRFGFSTDRRCLCPCWGSTFHTHMVKTCYDEYGDGGDC